LTTLPDIIVRGRTQKGMTQNELAIAIEVKAGGAQISKWERGALPEPKNVTRMIEVLDLDREETWLAFGRAVDAANAL
jgi:ribosome-binding protein aMBF1 (putative translation factor)